MGAAMFEPDLLRAFVAVAESRGFTRAAERLHLTQSTISQQIRKLEERLGLPLFRRTTRQVELNEDGEALLFHARLILGAMEQAWTQLTSPGLDGGVVRLGATEDIATSWLPKALARFGQAHARVRLDVCVGITGDLTGQLERGELDLVLGKRRLGDKRGEAAGRDRMVWVGRINAIDFRLGRQVRLAVFPPSCVYRGGIIEALQGSSWNWDIAYTSPSLAGIRAAVAAGLAVTALPEIFAGDLSLRIPVEAGLPALPDIEFAIFGVSAEAPIAVRELKSFLLEEAFSPNTQSDSLLGNADLFRHSGAPEAR